VCRNVENEGNETYWRTMAAGLDFLKLEKNGVSGQGRASF
jgi:hypothetical protein